MKSPYFVFARLNANEAECLVYLCHTYQMETLF